MYPRPFRAGDRPALYYFELTDAAGNVVAEKTMPKGEWHAWQEQIARAQVPQKA